MAIFKYDDQTMSNVFEKLDNAPVIIHSVGYHTYLVSFVSEEHKKYIKTFSNSNAFFIKKESIILE